MASKSNNSQQLDDFLGITPPSRWQRLRRWLVLLVVVVLAVAGLYAWLGGRSAPPRYATVEVTRGTLQVSVTATGSLQPTNEVTVGSELSGLVNQVLVDVNDRVERDQPLAVLDTLRLDDAIRRSEASLAQARANVQQAEATVDETAAALRRLDDIASRYGADFVSRADADAARASAARAKASLASAKAAVMAAEAQLSSDRTNLEKATIRSPVDGVVLVRNVEPGQTVAASFSAPELFVIAEDLSAMQAKVKIDEADVGQVREGLPASFTVDAFPGRVFPASVLRVDLGANSTTTSGGMASSSTVVSYTAVLGVENPEGVLRPGMTATATLVTSTESDVLLVPNAALRYTPAAGPGAGPQASRGGAFMPMPRMQRPESSREVGIGRGAAQTLHVLQADGSVRPLPVTVGATDGARTVVTGEGLQEGMRVVTGQMVGEP